MNGERPQVKHVVTGKCVSLLQHNHPSSHEAQLNCCPETTWPRPYDHTLANQRQRTSVSIHRSPKVLLLQRTPGRWSCECCEDTYGGVSAGSALLVLLMGSTALQFGPESVGPPVLQAALDRSVQRPLSRVPVQLQMFTQLAEGPQCCPAGRRRDKLIKKLSRRSLLEKPVSHGNPGGCRAP